LGVENFQRLITFSNELQSKCSKDQSYSPWKDLSNAILIASIGVDLTSEIAKHVKLNSQFWYFGRQFLVDNLVSHFATLAGIFFDSLHLL